jgi:hypothetical protein
VTLLFRNVQPTVQAQLTKGALANPDTMDWRIFEPCRFLGCLQQHVNGTCAELQQLPHVCQKRWLQLLFLRQL